MNVHDRVHLSARVGERERGRVGPLPLLASLIARARQVGTLCALYLVWWSVRDLVCKCTGVPGS